MKKIQTTKQLRTEIKRWAQLISVKPKQIRIQKMSRKWASCSTKGWVSFNSDLLSKPGKFQKYVIVHELLHLAVPNHGKLFKTMMNVHLPGWKRFLPINAPHTGNRFIDKKLIIR